MDSEFEFKLTSDSVFFTDTIKHGHPFIERYKRIHDSISFHLSGKAKIIINEKPYTAEPFDIIYNARGNTCEVYADGCEEFSIIAVDFNFSESDRTPSLPFPVKLTPKNAAAFKELFFEMRKQFFAEKPGYKTVCSGLLLQIIGLMYNEIYGTEKSEMLYGKIAPGIFYINEKFKSPGFQISVAAEKCGMTEGYFRRIFKTCFDISPSQYVNSLKITEAKNLLDFSKKTIAEIAEHCGFSDAYSFSHFFKNKVGTTPKEYRLK